MKLLSEKFVQDAIIEHLFKKGWGRNLRSKGVDEHGVDIKVRNNKFARYWLVECKGDASKTAKHPRSHREVCFNLAIGQIVTRMKSQGKSGYKYGYKYGIGFPVSFKDLVMRRLPFNAVFKLNLYIFLVDSERKIELINWRNLKAAQTDVR